MHHETLRALMAVLIIILVASSCSIVPGAREPVAGLPPVERLGNTGSFTVEIDRAAGVTGEYSVPYLGGPYPAVVLAHDGSLPADQVKEEARLLARHGIGVLEFGTTPDDALRQYARAGAAVVGQPGISTSEAALVLLSGDHGPALEAHRRLSGYRALILMDPEATPELQQFVNLDSPVAVFLDEARSEADVAAWRDATSLVGARAEVVVLEQGETVAGLLSPERRRELVRIIVEHLQ